MASAHLKEGGAGGHPSIPALGVSSSLGGIEMFGQANCVSRGAQEHPGLGEEEDFGQPQLFSLPWQGMGDGLRGGTARQEERMRLRMGLGVQDGAGGQ